MHPQRSELDLAIRVDGSPMPSTTYLTTVGVGAFCVVVETRVPHVHGLRLVSSYLGSPGDASRSTHHFSADGLAPGMTVRTFTRPPASAEECVSDHLAQLQDRLEEQGVSARFGSTVEWEPFRLA